MLDIVGNEVTDTGRAFLTRRRLLAYFGVGSAAVAAGGVALPAYTNNSEILPLRSGAVPLALNFNENSLGMSPKAVMAAQAVVARAGNRYADDAIEELTDMLATKHRVPAGWIVLGNGSTEVLGSIVNLVANESGSVVEPTPTFGAVRDYAAAEGVPVITVPVNADFTTNLGALKAAADRHSGLVLINLCDANNPTGTICDQDELRDWVSNASANQLFILDEAYVDYAQLNPAFGSMLPLVRAGHENLIIARTFSKVYGMAGMRVGYGIAAPATMQRLRPFTASWNLSAAGVASAMASLKDSAFYQQSLSSNAAAKEILVKTLDDLSLRYIPASTNFLLHRIRGPVADYQRRMKANGILVGRRMTAEDGWNRISIGTPAEMQAFCKTLYAFRERHWV
jgi:histidinol-phosphate aminotransferase